jgi:hypothetical protein
MWTIWVLLPLHSSIVPVSLLIMDCAHGEAKLVLWAVQGGQSYALSLLYCMNAIKETKIHGQDFED